MRQWLGRLVVEAGRRALNGRRGVRARTKPDGTLVTNLDENVQAFLVSEISREFPHDAILAEEQPGRVTNAAGNRVWAIDPIDGTRSYALGFPIWSVSVGLIDAGRPVAGAVYIPRIDELYVAADGVPELNGRAMSPPEVASMRQNSVFIVSGRFLRRWRLEYPGAILSLGSTAAHVAYVGAGAAVGTVSTAHVWDLAGAAAIVEPLGVEMRYLNGEAVDFAAFAENLRAREPMIVSLPELFGPLRRSLSPKASNGG